MSTPEERTVALALAERLLDEPNADPDDDLRILSRQLRRSNEARDALRNRLEISDDGSDRIALLEMAVQLRDMDVASLRKRVAELEATLREESEVSWRRMSMPG